MSEVNSTERSVLGSTENRCAVGTPGQHMPPFHEAGARAQRPNRPRLLVMLVLAFTIPCLSACVEIIEDALCGNGTVNSFEDERFADEECDDGNTDDGDGCSSSCQLECGDGTWDSDAADGYSEECDDGNNIDDDGCTNTCTLPVCGDGIVQLGVAETCDDGNTADGDGCSSACACEAVCGDGIVENRVAECAEQCDDGNEIDDDECRNDCTLTSCGNGSLDPGEACDDGNNLDGDGCRANCTEEVCGDGILDPGEACDDGDNLDGDGCRADCTLEECGDGILDPAEECDQGAGNSDTEPDACRTDCTLPSCGDNVVDTGEACDDGNNTDGDGCQADCALPFCGDGIQDPGETCDDGNGDNCDGCTTSCMDPTCGDNFYCPGLGEQCDDGNLVDGDGCESDCTVTPGGTFEITRVYLTPDVNFLGGVRPRFTSDMAIDVVVETNEGMTSVLAEIVSCNPAEVSDCTPVSDTPPSATSWSLRLPGFVGSAPGTLFSAQVTAEGPGSEVDQQTVDLEVYPVDPGLDVTCTKRYDSGSLYVAFTLVDNGNLPIDPGTGSSYTLGDMFDARFWLSQEGQETGFALDETDPIRTGFILVQPTEFNLNDDGIYEMIFTGLLGFVEPIQAHLLLDTMGGGNDVCTLVP